MEKEEEEEDEEEEEGGECISDARLVYSVMSSTTTMRQTRISLLSTFKSMMLFAPLLSSPFPLSCLLFPYLARGFPRAVIARPVIPTAVTLARIILIDVKLHVKSVHCHPTQLPHTAS